MQQNQFIVCRTWGICLTALVLVFGGCGKAKPKLKDVQASRLGQYQVEPALYLKPQILSEEYLGAGEPGAFLSENPVDQDLRKKKRLISKESTFVQTATQHRIEKGEEVIFRDTFLLPLEGDLYLTWNADAFPSAIQDAYFVYNSQNSKNEKSALTERKIARKDSQGRWFIPIVESIGRPSHEISEFDQHEIAIELQLSDDQVIYVRVLFSLKGPLPKIAREPQVVTWPIQEVIHMEREFVEKGHSAITEIYRNPSQRPLALWLWIAGRDGIYVQHQHLLHGKKEEVRNPVQLTELRIKQGLIDHHPASERKVLVEPQVWTKVVLSPRSQVQLEWWVNARSGAVRCPFPRSIEFPYWPIRFRLAGSLKREVRISDRDAQAPSQSSSGLADFYPVVLSSLQETEVLPRGIGYDFPQDFLEDFPSADCQGFYY